MAAIGRCCRDRRSRAQATSGSSASIDCFVATRAKHSTSPDSWPANARTWRFLNPPYNVRVRGVVGRGQIKHQEFAMASGEMAAPVFTSFLTETLTLATRVSIDGAVHFVCMDWRHIGELVQAGRTAYGAMLNLIAWVKSNAGQGSFYRSQHELIGVFRVGESPHLNTIELGRHGRSRSNVWKYA